MSVMEAMRTKRLWIALAATLAILFLLLAVGALLVSKGTIPASSQLTCICTGYLVASIVGGLIAGKQSSGRMTASLINAILLILITVIMALAFYGGLRVTSDSWKMALSVIAGALIAGILGATRKGKKSKKKLRLPARSRALQRR